MSVSVGEDGFDLHFAPEGAKLWCRCGPACIEQLSTGQLHLMGSNPPPFPHQTKKPSPLGLGFGLAGLAKCILLNQLRWFEIELLANLLKLGAEFRIAKIMIHRCPTFLIPERSVGFFCYAL